MSFSKPAFFNFYNIYFSYLWSLLYSIVHILSFSCALWDILLWCVSLMYDQYLEVAYKHITLKYIPTFSHQWLILSNVVLFFSLIFLCYYTCTSNIAFIFFLKISFIGHLFWRKCRVVVIVRLSSLLLASCKNFKVAHYSESIKDINTKLGILAHHDKVQLQDKRHYS